jgi:hypothetical protein
VVAVVVTLCLSGCATIGGPRIGDSIEPATTTPLHVRADMARTTELCGEIEDRLCNHPN